MGLPANDDFNDGEQDGFGCYQVTQRDGRRASTAVAYLHPVMDRPNLTVETHAHVLQGRFRRRARESASPRSGRASCSSSRAEREVIVCGGAYNSPQLLTLSGIGRPEELELLQIPLVAESARGRHEPPGPSDRGRHVLHRGGVLAQGRAQRREPRDSGCRARGR